MVKKNINCKLLTLHWPIWHAYVQDNKKVLNSIKPTRLVVSFFGSVPDNSRKESDLTFKLYHFY